MLLRVALVCILLPSLSFSTNQTFIPASQNARLSTAQSSSFQHTAGPSHSHSHSNPQSPSQYRQRQHHAGTGILGMPQAASSLADSMSMTQSMMEDGEGRSIK